MRWENQRRSDNIEDRRGQRIPGGVKIAGGGGIVGLIVTLIYLFAGGGGGGGDAGVSQGPTQTSPEEERLAEFVSVVLASTEDTWNEVLPDQTGERYREPRLVLFRGAVQSACGTQSSAVGPFYCPGDDRVYLDLDFFDQMTRELNAPGDFAQAYVIGHEVGHHIQNVLGISTRVHREQQRLSKTAANGLSVRLELQADCLAGVWAHHADDAQNILEEGDIEEAMRAARAIGDDALQKKAQGYTVPDSFTHGTSEQRMRWFRKGMDSGSVAACNTFEVASL